MMILQAYRLKHHSGRNSQFTQTPIPSLRKENQVEPRSNLDLAKARLRPEFAQWLDAPSQDLVSIGKRYQIDLISDDGIPPAAAEQVPLDVQVIDHLIHDPSSLEELPYMASGE